MELKKIVPRGNTGEGVRTIVLPWKGGRGLDETMAASSPTLELKAVKTLELWLESSTRVAKSPSRQVAKSPSRQVDWSAGRLVGWSAGRLVGCEPLTFAKGPPQRLGRDLLGGDACLGPPQSSNIPNGLTTETSAQIPWLRKLSHPGMLFGYNQHLDQSMLLIFKLLRYFRAIRFD